VPSLSRDEMLAAIAVDLGIDTAGANTTRLVRALQERLIEIHSEGRSVVALIDEAHAMPLATLEEIRLLSNLETEKDKLLQIVLFGQPELDAHLALPNMRQLKERITHSFTLGPLPPRDVSDYVNFRLRAAGYHGPRALRAGGAEDHRRRLRRPHPAHQHLRRQDAPRRVRRRHPHGHRRSRARGGHRHPDHPHAPRIAAAPGGGREPRCGRRRRPRVRPRPAVERAGIHARGGGHGAAANQETSRAPATAAAPTAAIPAAPAATAIPVATTVAAPTGDKPGTPRDPVASRIAAGRELLANAASSRYAVQLMVTDARERAFLESYLAEAGRSVEAGRLYVVPQGSPEVPRLGLLLGGYRDRDEALAALDKLPTQLRQFKPYVRTLDAVREEVRRAERSVNPSSKWISPAENRGFPLCFVHENAIKIGDGGISP
jgi:hypothetical protein